MRAIKSAGPPAGKGTISLTGLSGYDCAAAVVQANSMASHATMRMVVGTVTLPGTEAWSDLADLGVLDHLLPFGDLSLDVGRELGGRVALGYNPELKEPCLDVRRLHDRGDFLLQ